VTIAIKPDSYLSSPPTARPANASGKLTWLQYAAKRAYQAKVKPDHASARFALFIGSELSPLGAHGARSGRAV
jgi:hypothetical protein